MYFRITKNTLSPELDRLLKLARNKAPVLRAMGTVFKSITKGTFNSVGADMRPSPWKPKFGGTPSNLYKSGQLARSFHLTVNNSSATVSTPMSYAAIHQFGGKITAKGKALAFIGPDGQHIFRKSVIIPPRPFFPVTPDGRLTPAAEHLILEAGRKAIERQK